MTVAFLSYYSLYNRHRHYFEKKDFSHWNEKTYKKKCLFDVGMSIVFLLIYRN